jgi:mannonate dehydratase
LFVNRNEWVFLAAERLIEFFNVRTAWHVNMHLDLATYNFGIQEQNVFSDTTREVFPGAPEIKGGHMYCNDRPGLGIDVDEKVAAKYPFKTPGGSRGNDRRLDGSIVRP